MTLRLNGSSSGYTEIDAPAAAGSNTLTLPTGNGSANQFIKNGSTAGELEYSSMVETSTGVGINQSSPGYPLDVGGNIRFGSNTGYALLQYGTDSTGTDNWHVGTEGDGTFRFYNGVLGAGVERMRITSGGTLRINQNSSDDPSGNGVVGVAIGTDYISCNGNQGNSAVFGRVGSDGSCVLFRRHTSNVGSISVNASSTAYNTSSDHRLKENVVDLDGAITRVKQLAPKRFNFIADADTTVDGFLAHEAQTVVPEAVTGTHNEVDDDGNPVMQGIDQSKLVPLLTAALQEAIAEIETLKTKVAALEAGS